MVKNNLEDIIFNEKGPFENYKNPKIFFDELARITSDEATGYYNKIAFFYESEPTKAQIYIVNPNRRLIKKHQLGNGSWGTKSQALREITDFVKNDDQDILKLNSQSRIRLRSMGLSTYRKILHPIFNINSKYAETLSEIYNDKKKNLSKKKIVNY